MSATGYSDAFLGPINYEPGETPSQLSTALTLDTSTVSGTVTVAADSTSPSSTPIDGLELKLSSTSSTSFKPETTTTLSNGSYSFSTSVPTGTYSIEVTSPGYYEQSPVSFATQYPNPTVDNFVVYAQAEPLAVNLSTTSGTSSQDLAGATVTLTPITPSSSTSSCASGDPLLGYPSTAQQSGTATAASNGSSTPYVANFNSLAPDVYSISVTGKDIPAQPSSLGTVTLCPAETNAATSVTIQQGQVTGTVTDTSLAASTSVTVTITATPTPTSSSTPTLTTSCTLSSTASSDTCADYTLEYLASNTSYTITATATGYTFSPLSTSFEPSGTNATSTLDFTASAS